MNDKNTAALSDEKTRLLALALDRTSAPGSTLSALRFRAEHHPVISSLDELEREGLLKRDGGNYLVSALALPLVGTAPAAVLLGQIELLYGALRRRYLRDQDRQVLVATLTDEVGMSRAIVVEALQRMQDIESARVPWRLVGLSQTATAT